jgi:trk system potassium uptake protein TrkH
MGNTGFGVDVAAELPIVKWLLSLVMLIGRLEIFTILVLLTPTFWRKG